MYKYQYWRHGCKARGQYLLILMLVDFFRPVITGVLDNRLLSFVFCSGSGCRKILKRLMQAAEMTLFPPCTRSFMIAPNRLCESCVTSACLSPPLGTIYFMLTAFLFLNSVYFFDEAHLKRKDWTIHVV